MLPITITTIPKIVYFNSLGLLCSCRMKIPPKVAITTFNCVQINAEVFPLALAEII